MKRMTMTQAIEAYVADMYQQGRFRSKRTEDSYRACLHRHASDVGNRNPWYIGRSDIRKTLSHWKHPNSASVNLAILRSFYDWCQEEGLRKDNPARQIRRPKRQPVSVYRLTKDEARAMLSAALSRREKRAIYLGILAGLRNSELRGLQGRHFQRKGWVWVSHDIAKGQRERWVPVLAELEPIIEEIRGNVGLDEYVLPAQRFRDVGVNRQKEDRAKHPSSSQALRTLVQNVAKRAGIAAPIHPHLMRHAFGDHLARFAGMRNAQFLLGHAGIGTTETYVGTPTLDELREAVSGFGFGTNVLGAAREALTAHGSPTQIEPVQSTSRIVERLLEPLTPSVELYAAHFRKSPDAV